jgi:Protein of unknown function (DUF3048) N-terminal domain/Protein of unknown function (DUF3048) C-terminal domain
VGLVVALVIAGAGVLTMSGAQPTPEAAQASGRDRVITTKSAVPSPTRAKAPNNTYISMAGRAPLTGLPTDPATLAHPAVTVKVSNESAAHPQRGLNQADIVFVELITTATTRLAAVYHSTFPEEVGPVRSLRPMDAPLIGPTRGVLGDTMAADWVLEYVHGVADVDDFGTITVNGAGAYRIDNRRRAPNHVFANPATLLGLSTRTAPPAPYFRYAPNAARSSAGVSGSSANRVDIAYGGPASAYWTYDAAGGRWQRFEARGPHVLQDSTQISATNVLVLHTMRDTSMANAGEHMVVLDFVDTSGPLELFTGGRFVTGRWTKGGVNEPFLFTDPQGRPLLLAPGNTWLECVSETIPVSVTPVS